MINKGDYFILEPKDGDRSYRGMVFEKTGSQGSNLYAQIIASTGKGEIYPWKKGEVITIDLDRFQPIKANRDTLETAGLETAGLEEAKSAYDLDDDVAALKRELEEKAEFAKVAFCDELIRQTVKLAKRNDHLLVEAALNLELIDSISKGPKTPLVDAAKKYIDLVAKIEAAKIATA